MANKIIVALMATLALAGCATNKAIKMTADVKPIAVPIVYSPAPPVIPRPDLPHSSITSTDSDGIVVKKYAASVEALLGYIDQLEDVMKQYKDIHDSYGALASKVADDWKAKTGTDLQVPQTPDTTVTVKTPATPTLVVPPTTLH